jgi:hypothetical protein
LIALAIDQKLSAAARNPKQHINSALGTFPRNGRPVGTRTPDLYRVNSEVQKLNPFACLAFPFIDSRKMA